MSANPFTDSLLSAYRHDTALAAQLAQAVAELERRRGLHLAGMRRNGLSNDAIRSLTGLSLARIKAVIGSGEPAPSASSGDYDADAHWHDQLAGLAPYGSREDAL